MRVILFSSLLLILFLSSCSSHKNDSESLKMAHIYVDLLIAGEKAPYDSTVSRDLVFQKYDVTNKNFQQFLKSLGSNQKKWDEFFNLAQRYLDSLKSSAKAQPLLKQSEFQHK